MYIYIYIIYIYYFKLLYVQDTKEKKSGKWMENSRQIHRIGRSTAMTTQERGLETQGAPASNMVMILWDRKERRWRFNQSWQSSKARNLIEIHVAEAKTARSERKMARKWSKNDEKRRLPPPASGPRPLAVPAPPKARGALGSRRSPAASGAPRTGTWQAKSPAFSTTHHR